MKKVQKVLGLDDDAMRRAIEEARANANEASYGVEPCGNGLSITQYVNILVYLLLISVFFYFANRDYGVNFSSWLKQTFPREAAVLGI
mmetsp:Transcript_21325/g.48437  ORF Transcript_21325/g.48437 Transcript_21325/m.48437 type:complete len:88 (+) Transcript_21325:45-308(+)